MTRVQKMLGTPLARTAAVLLGLVAVLAVLAPVIWGRRAETVDMTGILAPPSAAHWAGTDGLGRDLLARVLVATRLTLLLTLEATAIGVVAGFLLGAAPFLLGRVLGRAVTWLIGMAVAFPGILLALFFAVIFGTGAASAALALGLASAPAFARLCQTLVAGVLARDFIAAAQIGGVGRFRILFRHILPNIGAPLAVNATAGAGSILLSFAGLSFLGLGVQPPAYDWGRLMMECLQSVYVYPLASLTPGLAVVLAGLAFNLTGETIAHSLGIVTMSGLRGQSRRARAASRPGSRRAGPTGPASVRTSGASDWPVVPADVELTSQDDGAAALLSVRGLRVTFPTESGWVSPVRGVSFDIAPGEAVGLVGESGSGKSLTALAVAQLIEFPGRVAADAVRFAGAELTDGTSHRHLLGTSLAMVFQDPMTSLNPTRRVGAQLAELGRAHGGLNRRAALARAVDRLEAVRIPEPARRARQYPHEFSGGMRQRAMIGLGVMLNPRLIIADEPTTALDVTVQAQVLDLLASIRRRDGVALWLISHDVSVVAAVCDRTLVMYGGRIVEDLPTARLRTAAHPYTRALVAAVPTMTTDVTAPLATIPGRPPGPGELSGCAFAPRCPLADDRCRAEEPAVVSAGAHRVACWHVAEAVR
ncbi:MAG: dipeptide/oligopeptide/nickel ABC transporter permease/ATP-binding protein [Propionibacteriaceae bacterium]|jgi:oligopeptide/dipeptide ABC transporter ATP-binding protein|nr:dipeptide/oligopeptide/nickel ABC transporter permease/ATP-binding protein [Propionibacteriaceae bacterium]